MSAIDPAKLMALQELNRRRAQLSPEKQQALDELNRRLAPPLPSPQLPDALQAKQAAPPMSENAMGEMLMGVPGPVLGDRLLGAGKNLLSSLTFGAVPGLEPSSPEQDIGAKTSEVAQLSAAAKPALDLALPKLTTTRAKSALNAVAAKVGDIPIDATAADDVALKAMQAGGRGAKTPGEGDSLAKVFRDYIATREQGGDLTFDKAQQFIKNANIKMGSDEWRNLSPSMQQLMGAFKAALRSSSQATAAQAGMGELYAAGVKEFAQAKRIQGLAKALGTAATVGAAGAGLTHVGRNAVRDQIINMMGQ